MRFYKFLNESRSKKIDEKTFLELFDSADYYSSKKNFRNNIKIYRGLYSEDRPVDPYYIIKPSEFTRTSKYANGNFYTLFIDNFQSFRNYPKRSKSIVCTTNLEKATDYDTPYYVFPKNGSKIGICPTSDIWYSGTFSKSNSLNDYNKFINDLIKTGIKLLGASDLNISYDIHDFGKNISYSELLLIFNKIEQTIIRLNNPNIISKYTFTNYDKKKMLSDILNNVNKKSIISQLEENFNPETLNFKLATIENFNMYIEENYTESNREVWTDGDCLMIKIESADILNSSFPI